MKQQEADFDAGQKYQYSNSGYALLSMVIEKVSGHSYSQFLDANIFKALGMTNTLVFDDSQPEIKKRTIGFNDKGRKDDYNIFTTGAGGIYSNLDDLFKWEQSLYKPALISKETLQQAFTPFKLNNDSLSHYGFGWNISTEDSTTRYWHTGSLAGFRTYLERDIAYKNTIIFLTNMGDAVKRDAIAKALRNILDDKKYLLPRDRVIADSYTNFAKYSESNMKLNSSADDQRVVFMGNSITEAWAVLSPGFFSKNNYINRGISGQVTHQMLLRFRKDVI